MEQLSSLPTPTISTSPSSVFLNVANPLQLAQFTIVSVRVFAPELRPDPRPQRQEVLLPPAGAQPRPQLRQAGHLAAPVPGVEVEAAPEQPRHQHGPAQPRRRPRYNTEVTTVTLPPASAASHLAAPGVARPRCTPRPASPRPRAPPAGSCGSWRRPRGWRSGCRRGPAPASPAPCPPPRPAAGRRPGCGRR